MQHISTRRAVRRSATVA